MIKLDTKSRERKERRCVWSVAGRSEGNWEEKKAVFL